MPNVFQSVVAARRAFREIKMLCTFRHDNVNSLAGEGFTRITVCARTLDSASRGHSPTA